VVVTKEVDVEISENKEVDIFMESDIGVEIIIDWDKEDVVRSIGVGRGGALIIGAPTRL
jgi:hypothetical protein